ncbi:hypothetical protein [Burkholderia lata]|uniref:hypothetical protein n=1 Tax=Burkholderia lata (strain ATCC 17760 / DSM 23089 / LMG 22485 / NCIMB 9086 / R18194 / 383) TaxID=482957 RepID=UPI001582EBFF|nr:hypothetical protein [Burkholderia lata]
MQFIGVGKDDLAMPFDDLGCYGCSRRLRCCMRLTVQLRVARTVRLGKPGAADETCDAVKQNAMLATPLRRIVTKRSSLKRRWMTVNREPFPGGNNCSFADRISPSQWRNLNGSYLSGFWFICAIQTPVGISCGKR